MTESSEPVRFTLAEITSVMIVGVLAGLVLFVQPLLLAQLAAEGRLSAAQMGQAATVEALGMGIATAVAGLWLKPERLRILGVIAVGAMILCNLATTQVSGNLILLARVMNGAGAGVMIWMFVGLMTRVALPARLIAIFVTVQSACAMVLASLFSSVVLPRFGVMGGYVSIVVLNIVMLACLVLIPQRYPAREGGTGATGAPPPRGLLALLAVIAQFGGIFAVWVYVVPLAKESGLSDANIGLSVSIALGSQIAAGICATALAARLNETFAVLLSIGASLAAVGMLAFAPGGLAFTAAVVAIAFFWMFVAPFQMPYLLGADPSGRAGMLMPSAQTLGIAAGPAIASLAVSGTEMGGALAVSAALFIASACLVVFTTVTRVSPDKVPNAG